MRAAKEIKKDLVPHVRAVCAHLLPNGFFDGQNWRVGSVRGECGSSLSVSCEGRWAGWFTDFAESNDCRGDILKLWCMVRRIPFVDALEEAEIWLEMRAPLIPPSPLRTDQQPVEPSSDVPVAMPAAVAVEWQKGLAWLSTNPAIQRALDQWRGWPPGTTAELSGRGLVACIHLRGMAHWAFTVQYPTAEELTAIGFHFRPVRQDPNQKSPWFYRPNTRQDGWGIPSVPFVLGGRELQRATLVVVTEGQWDAVTWAAVAGWLQQWPERVTVFGLRGATSWRTLLSAWGHRWPVTSTFLLVPDGDEAGIKWSGELESCLRQLGHEVQTLRPPDGLDFSDWNAKEHFTAEWINDQINNL